MAVYWKLSPAGLGTIFDFNPFGYLKYAFYIEKKNFFQIKAKKLLIKEGRQCSSKILNHNYLASKFTMSNVYIK